MLKEERIAAQLFNVRDHLKDPEQIAGSLARIRGMGYRAVELAGLGEWNASTWKSALDEAGLSCCAIHLGGDALLGKPAEAADVLSTLGCGYAVYPFPAGVDFGSEEAVRKMLDALTEAGRMLGGRGFSVLYHNHDIEFMTHGGRPWLEHIYEWTDPRLLQAELDVHWVQAGGGNPERWCRRLRRRLPILHLKDYGIGAERQRVFREIGSGNLEWEPILKEAGKSGCQWYVVEQDKDWVNDDPFEALETSLKFLKDGFCR